MSNTGEPDTTVVPDKFDELYEACKKDMLDKGVSSYELNEMVVDQAYFVIGAYAYILDNTGRKCMFPYKVDLIGHQHIYRVKWLEGVILDETVIRGVVCKVGRGHEIPIQRILTAIDTISGIQGIMRNDGHKWETH